MTLSLHDHYRQLLDAEIGAVRKAEGPPLRVAVAFPNRYRLAMANLAFQAVYERFNRLPYCRCDRVFLPEPDQQHVWQHSRQALPSLECRTPLDSFDLIAFTLSYENDYINVLRLLRMGHIPVDRMERTARHPIILAGGITMSANPEPLAGVLDIVSLGEAECVVEPLCECLMACREDCIERDEVVIRAAQIPGIYDPARYHLEYSDDGMISRISDTRGGAPPQRVNLLELDRDPVAAPIITPHGQFGKMGLVEVSRGCPRRCRFCLVGNIARPFKTRDAGLLLDLVKERYPVGTVIGLVGAALGDYPQLEQLCGNLLDAGYRFSLSSLRIERISRRLLRLIKQAGQKTLTIAPESPVELVRLGIGKPLAEDAVRQLVADMAAEGLQNLKCYFMIGLPGSEIQESEGIVQWVKRLNHEMRLRSARSDLPVRVSASVSCFVPKPQTPFQWAPMANRRQLEARISILRRITRRNPSLRITHDLPKWALLQGVFARGDRRSGLVLRHLMKAGNWRRGFTAVNLSPDFYLHRRRLRAEILPWDHLYSIDERDRFYAATADGSAEC